MIFLKGKIFSFWLSAQIFAYIKALSRTASRAMVRQSNAQRPEKMPIQRLYLSRAQVTSLALHSVKSFSWINGLWGVTSHWSEIRYHTSSDYIASAAFSVVISVGVSGRISPSGRLFSVFVAALLSVQLSSLTVSRLSVIKATRCKSITL